MNRPKKRACTSSTTQSTCRRAASASQGFPPSRRPCSTPSSPPRVSGCASFRSATNWLEAGDHGGQVTSCPSFQFGTFASSYSLYANLLYENKCHGPQHPLGPFRHLEARSPWARAGGWTGRRQGATIAHLGADVTCSRA